MNDQQPDRPYRAAGAPRPARRPRRRYTKRQVRRNRILAGVILALCLALVAGLVWLLFFRPRESGPTEPDTFDFGTAAAPWAKNENGIFYSSDGAPVAEAVLKGIDVSKYQGEVDWEKAKAAGIDFAILRCGFGSEWNGEGDPAAYTQDDEQWRRNADECTRLGIPFGAYLYSYATTEERARREADHVARLLGLVAPEDPALGDYTAAPYRLAYPVFYDLEDASITDLFPQEAAALTAAFFDQLESHGYTGEQGIYASLNWVRGRLQDPGFDEWRDNFWIARFNDRLGCNGPCRIWQTSYTEPGAAYGVQSDTVDVDLVLDPLRITGMAEADGSPAPRFAADTWSNELWLPAAKATATLVAEGPALPAPAEGEEPRTGPELFWRSSDESVATVDNTGLVRAVGEGACTVTVTRADGRLSATCTVRVGAVTVPVYATGALGGVTGAGDVSLADAAALAAEPEAILLDAGGSLQGTAAASLTGGMDMMESFSDAGYDLQALAGQDLAFGVSRLRADLAAASGPTLAADLRAADGTALLHRAKSWNNNRITNGMHYVLQRAGHTVGFFALADTGPDFGRYAVVNEEAPLAADAARTAGEQVAALRAAGAEAIVCILPPTSAPGAYSALYGTLKELGVTAAIDASLAVGAAPQSPLPVLPAGTGLGYVAQLDLIFAADGGISAVPGAVSAAALTAARGDDDVWTDRRADAYDSAARALAKNMAENDELMQKTLFTFAAPDGERTVSFGNYIAGLYETWAQNDAANWGIDAATPLCALAGGVRAPEAGAVSRAALLAALPTGARVQLVRTTAGACQALVDGGTVSETYLASLTESTLADAGEAVALITDTATLRQLGEENYTVLRDYGDVFWRVRMAINDATGGFDTPFTLPAAPQTGAGRR